MSGPPRSASLLGQRFTACGQPSMMYGVCIAKNINNLRVGVCQPEFDQLKQCIARQALLGKRK